MICMSDLYERLNDHDVRTKRLSRRGSNGPLLDESGMQSLVCVVDAGNVKSPPSQEADR